MTKAKTPRGWRDDPAWRHTRAKKAGEAARLSHHRRAYERAGRLHPIEAYRVGYTTGYNRAYHFWKARCRRIEAELAAIRKEEAA